MRGPEAKIKDAIRLWLRAQGAYFFFPVQSGFGEATLDILCCLHGRFVGVEVKAPGKKCTERQMHTIDRIRRARGYAVVVYSLAELQNALKMQGIVPPDFPPKEYVTADGEYFTRPMRV